MQMNAVQVIQAGNQWTSGICECTNDVPICCVSLWCCCVQYGLNVEKLNNGGCFGACCIYSILDYIGGCGWCVGYANRGALRNRLGIPGGSCEDCMLHFCCRCCALAQEGRELKAKEQFLKVPVMGMIAMNPVIVQQQPMMMSPQPNQMMQQPH